MTKTEELVIRNVIARLQCKPMSNGHHRETEDVREALIETAGLYLDTWVIAALERLLPESRDPVLALRLCR
jgi:hypothetical protein